MPTRFALVRLGALDLDRAAALHAESFSALGERAWSRQDIAGLLASGARGFLLQADGRDAGVALCRIAADEAELLTIAVRPGHRRQGGARKLLAAVIDHVRAAGARSLFLEVGVDNPAALGLYQSRGFAEVGRRPGYYRRGPERSADGLVMRLTLN